MRVKLQLVMCTDDGREETVTDIVTLQKGEHGDAGDNRRTPVEWLASFTHHSNPEEPRHACETPARHVQR